MKTIVKICIVPAFLAVVAWGSSGTASAGALDKTAPQGFGNMSGHQEGPQGFGNMSGQDTGPQGFGNMSGQDNGGFGNMNGHS